MRFVTNWGSRLLPDCARNLVPHPDILVMQTDFQETTREERAEVRSSLAWAQGARISGKVSKRCDGPQVGQLMGDDSQVPVQRVLENGL